MIQDHACERHNNLSNNDKLPCHDCQSNVYTVTTELGLEIRVANQGSPKGSSKHRCAEPHQCQATFAARPGNQ